MAWQQQFLYRPSEPVSDYDFRPRLESEQEYFTEVALQESRRWIEVSLLVKLIDFVLLLLLLRRTHGLLRPMISASVGLFVRRLQAASLCKRD